MQTCEIRKYMHGMNTLLSVYELNLQNTQDKMHRTQDDKQPEGPKSVCLNPVWKEEDSNHEGLLDLGVFQVGEGKSTGKEEHN